ncbi:SHOCT domain-containing protein [Salinicoccus sp. CNSTN-B1]
MTENRALDILNKRLAKGEISEEEYERLREKMRN